MKTFQQWVEVNHLGEREFRNFNAWRRAIKAQYPDATFEGDIDIAQAFGNGRGIGEWDGVRGVIYNARPGDIVQDPTDPLPKHWSDKTDMSHWSDNRQ